MPATFNPFLGGDHADPYPGYHRLRSQDSVQWREFFGAGFWLALGHEDVVSILRDPRFSADRSRANIPDELRARFSPLGLKSTRSMLTAEPPDHGRLRHSVSGAFTAAALEPLRSHAQRFVDGVIDNAERTNRLDVINDLAHPLALSTMTQTLGVPIDDHAQFRRWSSDILVAIGPLVTYQAGRRAEQSISELTKYLQDLVSERRAEPRDDLLTSLISAADEGVSLTESELYWTLIQLLVAGTETPTNFIGNAFRALLNNPDQMQRIRDDPALIESAVEELLRFDSPLQATGRVAIEDVHLAGQTIRKGDIILPFLGAANRDPDVFPSPDVLDVGRTSNWHVAFGAGIHFCIGAQLARLEAAIAFETVLRRLPRLRFATPSNLRWRRTVIARGLKSLEVSF